MYFINFIYLFFYNKILILCSFFNTISWLPFAQVHCNCWFVQRDGKVRVGKHSLFSLSLTTTQGVDRVGWTFIHDVKENKKDEIGGFRDKGML